MSLLSLGVGTALDFKDWLMGFVWLQNVFILSTMLKTKNRLMVTVHSKDVSEILPLYRMMKTDFPHIFWTVSCTAYQ